MENNSPENTNATENENTQTQEQTTNDKTFSQAELDKIVQQRVYEERAKAEEYKAKATKFDEMEEASKSELQKATERAEKLEAELKDLKKAKEVDSIRTKVAEKTGVPSSLLHGATEDECTAEAKAILDFAKSGGYPEIKDGGETKTSSKHTTADQFADWMKKNTK